MRQLTMFMLAIHRLVSPLYEAANRPGVEMWQPHVGILGETQDTLVSYIISRGNNPVDVRVACRFLWGILAMFRGTNVENWVSHGLVIARAGLEISPQNLLTMRPGSVGIAVAGGAAGAGQWMRALSLVLSPIRLQSGLKREYLDQLSIKYRSVAEELHGQKVGDNYTPFALTHCSWEQNTHYMRMAAVLDMFLSRFPEHIYSKVRFFTVSTRYRDCAALGDLRFVTKILGLSLQELAQWIWCPEIADDIERILKPGEEIDNRASYTPYLASMRLSNKSPYSATVNCSFNLFVLAIGCANTSAAPSFPR